MKNPQFRLILTCICFAILVSRQATAQIDNFRLWGTTGAGGDGYGTIFTIRPDGGGLIVPKSFAGNPNGSTPWSAVIQGNDGNLYGTNATGGQARKGTVYKIKPDGSEFQVLHKFDGEGGQEPFGPLVLASNGLLYGMTIAGGLGYGVIYRINTDGTDFSVIHFFDYFNGSQPQGGLIEGSNGTLYGMTTQGGLQDGGVVFRINLDGSAFTKLLDVKVVGSNPSENLLEGTDGKYYGLTRSGGPSNKGVIFRLDANGSNPAIVFAFDDTNDGQFPTGSLILGSDGKAYGVTRGGGSSNFGTIFKIGLDGTDFEKLFDFSPASGGQSNSGLALTSTGQLIGTTALGGQNNLGGIYTIDIDGTNFSSLYDLSYSNGYQPSQGPLLKGLDGDFYGTMTRGAASGNGLVYKLKLNGDFSKLVEYPSDPIINRNGLIKSGDGYLYGISAGGGLNGFGSVYKIRSDGTGFEVLFDFDQSTTGGSAEAHLLGGSTNSLFGALPGGGDNNHGVIFKVDKDGTGFTKILDFDGANGASPYAPLIELETGEIVGTAVAGGLMTGGVIYKFNQNGSGFNILFNFGSISSGQWPTHVVQGSNGTLYGVCEGGGAHGMGTLYSIQPDGQGFMKLVDFDGATKGSYPRSVVQSQSGILLGVTQQGGSMDQGTVFKVDVDGSNFSLVKSFDWISGSGPQGGGLGELSNGYLYGMTYAGGIHGTGTVFRVKSDGTSFSKVYDLNEISGTYPITTLVAFSEVSPQTITFEPLSDVTYDDPNFTIEAISSSSLPVTFISSNPSVATVSGGEVTITGAGTTTITAKQDGDLSFAQAPDVAQALVVNKKPQTITFPAPADKQFSDPVFVLEAFASSGLPIQYSFISNQIEINDNQVKILKPGRVTVTASQTGNNNFLSAEPVSVSFCIVPPKPVVTIDHKNLDSSFVLVSTSELGNQWYFNDELVEGAVEQSFKTVDFGIYKVMVNISGCLSDFSEGIEVNEEILSDVVTATSDQVGFQSEPQIEVYPNPSDREITVHLSGSTGRQMLLKVYGSDGRLVAERVGNVNADSLVDLQNLSPGIYYIKVISGERTYFKRVVKR